MSEHGAREEPLPLDRIPAVVHTALDLAMPLLRPIILDEYRASLRAKIKALNLMSDADWDYADGYEAAKRDVLDLLTGPSDA